MFYDIGFEKKAHFLHLVNVKNKDKRLKYYEKSIQSDKKCL